jgi:hypothetical protein
VHFNKILPLLVLNILVPFLMVAKTGDPGRFHFTSGQNQVEIPFYTFNNLVILPVMINDKVPLNFILDSGASQAIFFDRKLAQDLGIGFGRRILFSGVGSNNNITAFRARGVKLGLPGIEGNMMGMAVLSSDYLDMKRFDIHGVIGYQLFARFAIKIDYRLNILTLMEPDAYNPGEFQSMDVEISNSKPYINTTITLENNDEIPLRLLVDTGGAFGLSLINGLVPGIAPPKDSPQKLIGNGLGGEIKGVRGKAVLKLNAKFHTESTAIFINHKEFSRKGEDLLKQGSIGNTLLKEFVVIFDYINARILFQPHDKNIYTKM